MRVIHLIGGGDVGGAKIHVLTLIKELSKHIEVKLISFRHGAFADDARAMGINVEVVKTGTIIGDIKKVVKIVKAENYQVIHSHGAKANLIGTIVKRFVGAPTVSTVHSDYRLDYLHSMGKMLTFGIINTIALRFVDYYIAVSQNFKKMLVERKYDPHRIFTVYNGIDFDKEIKQYSRAAFASKYNIHLNESDIVIGILARLHPVKGLTTYLAAAKEVLELHPSVRFLIGGPGDERKSLERKAAELGITDKVHFLGFVDDAYEFMSCIDINVLTSLSESFPYVILEGTRVKRATISSDVGGISDLIESGANGFLFKPGDYRKLSEHMKVLVSDSCLREQMGQKLYEKARSQFSLENMCKTQLSIYNSVFERFRRGEVSKHAYDILLSGYYGFRNMGDDALLLAIINNLRSYKKDIRICVLSKNPAETRETYSVSSINRYSILNIYRTMKKSRLFINGGGNLIQDITSTRSLFYYLNMTKLAKKCNMKVMVYANGIGPLNKNNNRRFTTEVLNQVDIITLREELSKGELDKLGVNKPEIVVTADPVFSIKTGDVAHADSVFAAEGIDTNGPFIGFSVRSLTKYQYTNDEQKKYEKILALVADHVVDSFGAQPVFIPMHYPDDILIMESISSLMKNKSYIIKGKYDVTQMMGIISKMEILVGMRLHSLIFASSLNIPVIGLNYDPKLEGFLKYINQASAGSVKELSFDSMKSVIDAVWNNRTRIKDELEQHISVLREKSSENARIAIELLDK